MPAPELVHVMLVKYSEGVVGAYLMGRFPGYLFKMLCKTMLTIHDIALKDNEDLEAQSKKIDDVIDKMWDECDGITAEQKADCLADIDAAETQTRTIQ